MSDDNIARFRIRVHELADNLNELNLSQREQIVLLKDIKETVDHLNQVVFRGNGSKSLVSRMEVIETKVVSNTGKIDKISDQVDHVEIEKAKIKRNSFLASMGVVCILGVVIFDYINHTKITSWIVDLISSKI